MHWHDMNSVIIDLVLLINVVLLKTTLANKCDAAPYQAAGHVLLHRVIQSLQGTSSIVSCLDHCDGNPSCHSINWYSKTGMCQLNNGTHLSYPEGLVPDSTGRYMLYSPHPMVACSNKFCSHEDVCLMEKDGISYRCQSECMSPFGMQDGRIQDAQITASSSWNDNGFSPVRGRLNLNAGIGVWCASVARVGEYLQIDLKKACKISKIATQGRHDYDQWVEKYYLEYSQDGRSWELYKYGGFVKHFQGNVDKTSVVTYKLPSIIQARFIRFVALKWKELACMRVEIYGCD